MVSMNTLISLLIALFVILAVLLTILSCASNPPKVQLVDGRLRACPNSPNCVSSESDSVSSRIEPLTFQGPSEKAWNDLKRPRERWEGRFKKNTKVISGPHSPARFSALWMTWSFRMVSADGIVHVRSGSRVGYSDLGVTEEGWKDCGRYLIGRGIRGWPENKLSRPSTTPMIYWGVQKTRYTSENLPSPLFARGVVPAFNKGRQRGI